MDFSTQAKVATFMWLILVIAIAYQVSSSKLQMSTTDKVVNLISLLISALISIYSINCMVVGQCNAFAWIYVGLFTLSVLIILMVGRAINDVESKVKP